MALQPLHRRSGNLRWDVPLPYAPVPGRVPPTRRAGVALTPSRPLDRALQRTADGFFVKASYLFRL